MAEDLSESLPSPLPAEAFDSVVNDSPFRRTRALSDSIVLTGVARIAGDVVATLVDTETSKSHVVTNDAGPAGWQLVDMAGDDGDIETLTAQIQISGGEILSVRYEEVARSLPQARAGNGGKANLEERHLREARQAAINFRKGFSSDGYPDEPPPQVAAKLARMTMEQRERLNQHMIGLRNEGKGMDERRRIYNGLIDRSLQSQRR
ncbi:MAG: hypothetical protein AAF236_00630 [Verrucomicrobiota bacterium]